MYMWSDAALQFMIIHQVIITTVSDVFDKEELYMPTCRSDLGMNSREIPDDGITASSSYDQKSVGPLNSRIRTEKNGGAWCPRPQVSKDVYEWLEIDFGQLKVITLVETQGRFGNGQGQEFAPNYLLEYQRQDDGRWFRFRDRKGMEMLRGNSNTYIAELRELRPPIIARRIRFVPYSSHPRTVCMRVELYGCLWPDGIISYSMRQGDRRGTEMDFYDFTYDGQVSHGYLSGGLGQLTDLDEGNTNFRLDLQNIGKKGYEWIAWKNDTPYTDPVEIIFQFDLPRNFSAVSVVANNVFTKEVSVFQEARLYFSNAGQHYTTEPVVYEHLKDAMLEDTRNVLISIPNRCGRFVKLLLFFDSRWIMISEVRFFGEPTNSSLPPDVPPSSNSTVLSSSDIYRHNLTQRRSHDANKHREDTTTFKKDSEDFGPILVSPAMDGIYEAEPQSRLDDTYVGIIIGALTAFIFLIIVVSLLVLFHNRRYKFGRGTSPVKSMFAVDHVSFNMNDLTPTLPNGKLSNGCMVYDVVVNKDFGIETEVDLALKNPTNRQPKHAFRASKSEKRESFDVRNSTSIISNYIASQLKQNSLTTIDSLPPKLSYHRLSPSKVTCPSADLVQSIPHTSLQGISNVMANDRMAISYVDDVTSKHLEIPVEKLRLIENLGHGTFGTMHLCELMDDCHSFTNRDSPSPIRVALKTLDRHAPDHIRSEFFEELKRMMRLHDSNIVQVVGVCTKEEPIAIVIEHSSEGDLHQYLINANCTNNHPTLSYGCLVYIATQIASGMKFLETLNVVHRDLATRNCLVGSLYAIKISDFGRHRSLYSTQYYNADGTMFPIRWMAWESVLLRIFTCKSDIWSFAVTLWEILTFAQECPFSALTNEQVIENSSHNHQSNGQEMYLSQPDNCPKEIFDLMMECWNNDEMRRPSFREIHMFLQRKNMGYNPKDEHLNMFEMRTAQYNASNV